MWVIPSALLSYIWTHCEFPIAHAPVTLYDESNPMQEPFDNDTIFYRSEARTPSLEESAVVRFTFGCDTSYADDFCARSKPN